MKGALFVVLFIGVIVALALLRPAVLVEMPPIVATSSASATILPATVPLITSTPVPLVAYSPTPLVALVVLTDAVNVRSCPSVDCPAFAWLVKNQKIFWSGECSNGWAQIDLHKGWIYAKYIEPNPCGGSSDISDDDDRLDFVEGE